MNLYNPTTVYFVKYFDIKLFKFIIINMIQRLVVLIFIYIFLALIPHSSSCDIFASNFMPKVFAQETLKVNSINFDNSDSIIFLGTSGTQELNEIKIKKQTLTEPDRIFFDIEDAVITFPNSTYEIKNSKLSKVRIAQNSVEPNIVRIVIWNSPKYDSSQIKVLKIKNNIIIKLNNDKPLQQYLTQIYKETKGSSIEYYEKAIAIQETQNTKEADEIFNKVQQAFKEDDNQLVRPNIEQKQAKLKSRFFLEKAVVRNGSLLIGGIGVVNIEKPFTLTEPSRIVFDLPNTIVTQELRDKEIKLSETATAKIGQFEPSKARIVIKTDKPETYRPIYSTNLQTLLITNTNNITGINVTQTRSTLTYFKEQNINATTDVINITFSNPIIYSIQRTASRLNLTFFNLSGFNVESFNALAQKNQTGFEAKQISTNIYRISFPAGNNTLVDCYETLNASQLRFVFTKKIETKPTTTTPVITQAPKTQQPTETKPVQKPTQQVIQPSKPQTVISTAKPTTTQETKKEPIPVKITPKEPVKKTEKIAKPSKAEQAIINKIKNKVIVLDPGHGGNDTGALRGNILEKDLTLEIATKVKKCLQEKGLKNIIMTRSIDKTLTLDERVQISNNNCANIFVSIHINASVKSEVNGIETHYFTENGYNVAKVIHKELMENVTATDRGLFKSKFYVINHTEAPAVLLELGFISNEQERSSLTSEKRQMNSAKAIADGIVNYLLEH